MKRRTRFLMMREFECPGCKEAVFWRNDDPQFAVDPEFKPTCKSCGLPMDNRTHGNARLRPDEIIDLGVKQIEEES
jgi:predicted RNA-binding Zn-ribbon protein involved in translation (DUF1610 family)